MNLCKIKTPLAWGCEFGSGSEICPRSAGPKLHDVKQVSPGRFPCESSLNFLTRDFTAFKSTLSIKTKTQHVLGLSFGSGSEI